jgi:hypothetical protein
LFSFSVVSLILFNKHQNAASVEMYRKCPKYAETRGEMRQEVFEHICASSKGLEAIWEVPT